MSEPKWYVYLAIFGGSAALSLVLTPLAMRVALRLGVLDRPHPGKAHVSPVPYLGGLAIVVAFAAAVLTVSLLSPPAAGLLELGVVLGIAVALSVLGLVDDIRGLGPVIRVLCEILAAIGLFAVGVRVEAFASGDAYVAANLAITIVWMVGVTNAFNLLDNMDGLSAGVAAIAAGWFFLIAAVNGQFLVAGLGAALAGCALGFLRHNFHPARIYMGDAGSLFLGFMLGYLGLKLRFDAPPDIAYFFVPCLVLGVAILDTTLVTLVRIRAGRSPFQGGRDHMSHRIVFIGVPVRGAVSLIYGTAIGLGLIALVVSRIDNLSAYLLAGLVFAGGIFLGILLARVPVYRGSEVWAPVDAEREMTPEDEPGVTGSPLVRNRQARLGSLFGTQSPATTPADRGEEPRSRTGS